MQIGVRNRFIFVANTKAASTSLEQALAPFAEIQRGGTPDRKHIPMKTALQVYRFLFEQPDMAPNTFFRFAVMRDPLDWISSWYRYRMGNRVASGLPEGLSFADFWARKDWNIQNKDGSPYLQSDLMCGPNGGLLVDYIIRYETLDEEFSAICKALKLKVTLPRLNVSKVAKTDLQIPDALRDEIQAHYTEDLALLARREQINAAGMEHLRRTRSFRMGGPT